MEPGYKHYESHILPNTGRKIPFNANKYHKQHAAIVNDESLVRLLLKHVYIVILLTF